MKKIIFVVGFLFSSTGTFSVGMAQCQEVPAEAHFALKVEVKVKLEAVNEFKSAINSIVEPTRKEPGNIEYLVIQSPKDSTSFTVFEDWASAQAHQQHVESPMFKNYSSLVGPMFEPGFPIRNQITEIPIRAGYYKKVSDNTYVLTLEPGAKIFESLKAFQKSTGVLAASITGLGAFKNIQLGQYRFISEPLTDGSLAAPPKFPTHDDVFIKGHREVVSLTGNLTTSVLTDKGEAESAPHLHIAVAGSDDGSQNPLGGFTVVGGHLVEV